MKLAGSEGEVDNIGDCGNKYGWTFDIFSCLTRCRLIQQVCKYVAAPLRELTWDHTVLPATQQWWHSRLHPSKAGAWFSDPRGMQGWVDLLTTTYILVWQPVSRMWWSGFPRLLEIPGIAFVIFPGPGKSWKMSLVLDSPGNLSASSWKVVEFLR